MIRRVEFRCRCPAGTGRRAAVWVVAPALLVFRNRASVIDGYLSVLAKVPRISNHLREKTVSIAADLTRVVERTLAILMQIDGYRLLTPAAQRDVRESVALSAKVWFETLLSGELPSAQDMDIFREISQRREHQRVPLQSYLQALRLGLREIWSTYIALGELDERIAKELLADVSLYLLDHFDFIAQIIVRAYPGEQYRQPRWAELAIAIGEGARRSESARHSHSSSSYWPSQTCSQGSMSSRFESIAVLKGLARK